MSSRSCGCGGEARRGRRRGIGRGRSLPPSGQVAASSTTYGEVGRGHAPWPLPRMLPNSGCSASSPARSAGRGRCPRRIPAPQRAGVTDSQCLPGRCRGGAGGAGVAHAGGAGVGRSPCAASPAEEQGVSSRVSPASGSAAGWRCSKAGRPKREKFRDEKMRSDDTHQRPARGRRVYPAGLRTKSHATRPCGLFVVAHFGLVRQLGVAARPLLSCGRL